MSKIYNTLTLCFFSVVFLLSAFGGTAQVNFTANDAVQPYTGGFHPATNLGEYTSFTEEDLALLAAGGDNPSGSGEVRGVGVKSLRPGLFEGFMEVAGYESKLPAFQYWEDLGMSEHTVIVGFPSPAHKDPTQYCPGVPSELFANMYEPIWDGGANGTPVNEENYYALYLWKTVSLYKDYVRFWEIWNEPGYDYTGGLGYLPPGAEGSWWDNNPDPCDYKLRAPIFHYVRLLRISWEIIKTIDPDAYVVVSGTGYPSFLDAILRNTDNPDDGSVTADYPKKAGAYFDVMGYDSYPHFDGSLREWSDSLQTWIYSRHSDAAMQGILTTKTAYQEVLDSYGYNGTTYPEKLWIITEINLPRKEYQDYIGSAESQKNFLIKAMTACMKNDILQMQVYKLAEDTEFGDANDEFDLMGLYQRLDYNDQFFQPLNDEGIAHKTASDVLFGLTYDPIRTAALNLPAAADGGAFKDEHGNFTYVLWAKTTTDKSEVANAVYSFPAGLGISNLLKCEWNSSVSHNATPVGTNTLGLTATPIFLAQRIFSMNAYTGCAPFSLNLTGQASGATSWQWTIAGAGNFSFTTQNPSATLTAPGNYEVTLIAKNAAGQVIGQQTQHLYVEAMPEVAFDTEVSGPIVHFENGSGQNADAFSWNFGDGNTSAEPVPAHVYLQSGAFTVTLTASNECGSTTASSLVNVVSPTLSQLDYTADEQVPTFTGDFRPGTTWEFVSGWQDEELADIAAGNPLIPLAGAKGIGVKAIRTYIGESFFLGQGYESKLGLFQHYTNIDLRDNTFLLAFPAAQSRDPYFYCPDAQSNLFKDLYLDIWDNGQNGTPVNDQNPFALYVWNTVSHYKDHVRFWEIYNSPDFDLTGDKAWLPPGQLGNWWENNPDPCDYELRAPIFFYIRSLRIAYEIIKFLDEDAYVTISGVAFPSFLDAVCRNTDNPLDGSTATPYPLKGGAYFDAVGFKSYPHFDGSTIFYDLNAGAFAYERHSDAAVSGIPRVKQLFQDVLENYGYDGLTRPKKEWIISEANLPRKSFYGFLGSAEAQRNWILKAWVESVLNGVRQLNIFRLAESETLADATDPFQVMGFYQKMDDVTPFNQVVNDEGVALKTCSDLLFGADYSQQQTEAMNLPDSIRGVAFQDAGGNFIYVLWAETETDQSEAASATYSFPAGLGISQLHRRAWDFSQTGLAPLIASINIPLTGAPVFLTVAQNTVTPPVAFFEVNTHLVCPGEEAQFTDLSIGGATNWEWSFPGGAPEAHFGQTPPGVAYYTPGVYPVSLMVLNAAGEHTATYSNFITVEALPLAEFEVNANGAAVQFTNTSFNSTDFEWCYGDGFCDNAANPFYIYFENGTFVVTLTASNNCGESTVSQTLEIEATPTAAFTQNFIGNCDTVRVQFLDLSYSEPESWHWIIPGASPSESDLRYPIVTFPGGGFYEVTLVAGNGNGLDTLTKTVYVEGPVTTTQTVQVCEGDTYLGYLITNDTTFTSILQTSNLGCDSTLVTEVAAVNVIETSFAYSLCEGDFFHGVPVFSDTVFVETFPVMAGCDSVSTSEITVIAPVEVFLVENIFIGQQFFVGNQPFSQTGVFEVLLETAAGCDSLVHLNLTVVVAAPETPVNAWNIKAFPNPFSERVFIELEIAEKEMVTVEVFDCTGKRVRRLLSGVWLEAGVHRFGWEMPGLASGVYWVKIFTEKSNFGARILKI